MILNTCMVGSTGGDMSWYPKFSWFLNAVLIWLFGTWILTAIPRAVQRNWQEPTRLSDLEKMPGPITKEPDCGDLILAYRYLRACAPPEWDGLPPMLNCPYELPPRLVGEEPTDYTVARLQRETYKRKAIEAGCFPGEITVQQSEDESETQPDDRPSIQRLQDLAKSLDD